MFYRRYHTKEKRKARLSFIVGLLCRDTIILACESQTTRGNFKFTKTKKISAVDVGQDQKVLVAESGYETLSQRSLAIFKDRCKTLLPSKDETIAEVLGEAVREARKEHVAGLGEKTLDEIKDYFTMNVPFELMVAYYFDHKPCLFKVSGWGAVPEPCKGIYLSSGVGRELGDCLLDEHAKVGMEATMGVLFCISIVKKVTEYVEGCGGQVNIGIVRHAVNDGFGSLAGPIIVENEAVEDFAKKIQAVESETKTARQKAFEGALDSLIQEAAQRFFRDF